MGKWFRDGNQETDVSTLIVAIPALPYQPNSEFHSSAELTNIVTETEKCNFNLKIH